MMSYPSLLKAMSNLRVVFLFFFSWSMVTSFAHEFLINKAFFHKEGYGRKKAIMILIQTFLVAGMLLFLYVFLFKLKAFYRI